jgi:hypothetical protein
MKPLEKLNLNGNEIGLSVTQSGSNEALIILTSLLTSFRETLRELGIADCKLAISDPAWSSSGNETAAARDENILKRFFAATKCL